MVERLMEFVIGSVLDRIAVFVEGYLPVRGVPDHIVEDLCQHIRACTWLEGDD